jgi:hypothetical protein
VGGELEFLGALAQRPDAPALSDTLRYLLPLPVRVNPGAELARLMPTGVNHPDGVRGPRWNVGDTDASRLFGKGVRLELRPVSSGGSEKSFPYLVAEADGYACDCYDQIAVTRIREIFGDVDHALGEMRFRGALRIHGGVLSGVVLATDGDVEIHGLVEGAKITVGGNLILKGGMAGGGEGVCRSGKDVYASYVQQGKVEAGGSILVEGPVMGSELAAGKRIVLKGRSTLVGGSARAREEIVAPVVGSETAIPTEIALGYNPLRSRMAREIEADRERLDEERRMRMTEVVYASSHLGEAVAIVEGELFSNVFAVSEAIRDGVNERLDEEGQKYFKELSNALIGALAVERRREDLTAGGDDEEGPYRQATLRVEKVAHPGVTVSILVHTVTLDREYERVRFVMKDDGIEPVNL